MPLRRERPRPTWNFFEAYDLDLLKVMNDYDYPMPEGMEVMATAEDLKRLTPLDITRTPLGRQLKAVELIARDLRGKALFVDTVFNAWNTLKRNLVKEEIIRLMADHPEEVLAALEVINRQPHSICLSQPGSRLGRDLSFGSGYKGKCFSGAI